MAKKGRVTIAKNITRIRVEIDKNGTQIEGRTAKASNGPRKLITGSKLRTIK